MDEDPKWEQAKELDIPFICEYIRKVSKTVKIPDEPYCIQIYFPSIFKRMTGHKLPFGALKVDSRPLSSFDKDQGNQIVQDITQIWESGGVALTVFRDLSAIEYKMERKDLSQITEKDIMAPLRPTNTLQTWLESFAKTANPSEMMKFKEQLDKGLDYICNNVKELCEADLGTQKMTSKHYLLVKATHCIISHSSHKEIKAFGEACFDVMFCSYEIREELQEWLPREVYDEIEQKIEKARDVFKEGVKKGMRLSHEGLQCVFMNLAETCYDNTQFSRIDEPQYDLVASMSDDGLRGFAKILSEIM